MQSILEYNAQIESYRYIFYFSLIVGLVFAILTILLCVIFRVDEVFGDITGAYRRKAIKRRKDETSNGTITRKRKNTNYSGKRYADSRSRELETTEEITAKLRETARLQATEKLNSTVGLNQTSDLDETVPLSVSEGGEETVLLSTNMSSDDTVVLINSEKYSDETVVLSSNNQNDETVVLNNNVSLEEDVIVSSSNRFL